MTEATASQQQRSAGTDVADEANQYLTFSVAEERLAMPIDAVQEIIETPQITQVPMTPDYIRGVINLRGNVVPIVDLAARLNRGAATLSKRSCIVVVEVESNRSSYVFGMLVDEVKNILDIPRENVRPAPTFGSDISTDFIQAMGRVEDVFVIILAINHVLSVQELAELQKMTEGASLSVPEVGG
ncbi:MULTISPECIES: chemotaxis protein CheW [Thiorhodovibrio]|uniref:chemotaxis protein CheW n=1 Tax=Thiorhodovibrio TaxID=61593 RepID=UPI0019127AB5|nr:MULTISPECIES: chemotaxis protein CheW [Thiorhodovibrio]MBK5969075.1 chemotaxis protein CheW [Thiorhodovibrio winogradskyi]WPL14728.1 Chemotaxis protein CheW [Thiorhodovibrio litoralis]